MQARLALRQGVAATLMVSLLACTGSSSDSAAADSELAAPTGSGIGDPYYPDDGNPGYDVKGYHVNVRYHPESKRMDAVTTVTSTAKARLSSFHLDLIGMKVTRVTVNGAKATFTRKGDHELVVTPTRAVASAAQFVTVVNYHGKPGVDPVGAVQSGWYDATTPGGGFIAGEPHSCTLWYPCNDHPTDKARFKLAATVPRPFAVVSVGKELPLTSSTDDDGTRVRTYRWALNEATATYLTTIYIDRLTFERLTLADGTPVVSAYGPHPGSAPQREAKLPAILNVLADHWGPYPAPQAGGIFVNGDVPFSLETFTRPIYTEGADVTTIVHENGHQWWGDNVSVKRWRDVCLNECLASYSQWLWDEHKGEDLDAKYRSDVDGPGNDFLNAPLYDMGPGHEFDFAGVYQKGTYFVHALRNKIGDEAFFTAMQQIQVDHAGGNLSMMGLRNSLQSETGVDLTSFWQDWVIDPGSPSEENLHPGDL